jgi:disulfide bond formation protein DsbB
MAGLVIAAVSLVALAGAWIVEFMGYAPCPLCLEQRLPYYAAVPAGVVVAVASGRSARFAAVLLAAICAALLYNAGLGIYHAGAEWHFWPGPDTCSGSGALKPTNLLESLKHNQPIRCDEAALRIFGLSLAGYSVLISTALAAVGVGALWRARPIP